MKAQPEPKLAIQKAPKAEAPEADSAKSNDDSQEMLEIPIAGRTKMTVPKNKDNNAPKKESAAKDEDNTEAKDELNGILKRSPSMFASLVSVCCYSMLITIVSSNRFLQVLLPL